jgi:hypothetical protein
MLAYVIAAAVEKSGSSVETLEKLFTIVLALAIGEAFKQAVRDKPLQEKQHRIIWDRTLALASFVFLVVPFYHGMARLFFDTYKAGKMPSPYAPHLIVDTAAFLVEAFLFFVLSRSLESDDWRFFYKTVCYLCGVDLLWAVIVLVLRRNTTIQPWIWIDAGTVISPVSVLGFAKSRKWEARTGAIVCLGIIVVRTVIDYRLDFPFYFPPVPIS